MQEGQPRESFEDPPSPAESRHRADGAQARQRPPSQGFASLARRAAARRQGQHARHPKIGPPHPRAIRPDVARGVLRGPGGPDGRRVRAALRVGRTSGVVQLSGARKPAKRTRKSPRNCSTPSRSGSTRRPAARPGQGIGPDANPRRRPHPPNHRSVRRHARQPGCANDLEAQRHPLAVGESLRRTHQRARLDQLRAVAPDRFGSTGFGPAPACRNPRRRSSPATSCARPRTGSVPTPGRS